MTTLDKFCLAIKEFEGWKPGSKSFRNKNPGNIKFIGQRLAIAKDAGGFCIFVKYEDGYKTLYTMVYNACAGKSVVYKPTMTILAYFKKYAPSSDKNDPDAYAKFVAKKVGLPVDTQIKKLIS